MIVLKNLKDVLGVLKNGKPTSAYREYAKNETLNISVNPDEWEYTGEFRSPLAGEYSPYWPTNGNCTGMCEWENIEGIGPRLIFRKKKTPKELRFRYVGRSTPRKGLYHYYQGSLYLTLIDSDSDIYDIYEKVLEG